MKPHLHILMKLSRKLLFLVKRKIHGTYWMLCYFAYIIDFPSQGMVALFTAMTCQVPCLLCAIPWLLNGEAHASSVARIYILSANSGQDLRITKCIR